MTSGREFYLNFDTGELYTPPDVIRKCRLLANIKGPRPQGYWLVSVTPPVPVLGTEDITELILAERHQGDDLSKLENKWILVYVCRILNPAIITEKALSMDDIEMLDWALIAKRPELFPIREKRHPNI
jgi:hypothetical protein